MKVKKTIKKLVPQWAKKWYLYRRDKTELSDYLSLSAREVFTKIYNENNWSSPESISGGGSEVRQTETLIRELNKLLKDMKILSVLDIPCGDFNWMRKVDLTNIAYVGADIVEELITNNIGRYGETENRKFKNLNLITDPLPRCDLIIVRDCLVHLSYEDISKAVTNIRSSGSKYLLTTTFTDHDFNRNTVTGSWRPINLQKKPFYFPSPILIINENCTEAGGIFRDKSMALWEISKI